MRALSQALMKTGVFSEYSSAWTEPVMFSCKKKKKQHNPSWSPLMSWFSLSEVRVGCLSNSEPCGKKTSGNPKRNFPFVAWFAPGPILIWNTHGRDAVCGNQSCLLHLSSVISGSGEGWGMEDGWWWQMGHAITTWKTGLSFKNDNSGGL